MSKDVHIEAPVARLDTATSLEPPSVQELYRMTHAELKAERRKNQQLSDFARQTASICLALAKMLVDANHQAVEGDTITIPRWLHEQMLGASITVGQSDRGEPTVTILERGRPEIRV